MLQKNIKMAVVEFKSRRYKQKINISDSRYKHYLQMIGNYAGVLLLKIKVQHNLINLLRELTIRTLLRF